MSGFRNLSANNFVIEVLNDGRTFFADIEYEPAALELPEEPVLDEFQYYVHNVWFYLVHTLTWCKQLYLAIEFLSNYDYSKKINSNRADHLIYTFNGHK